MPWTRNDAPDSCYNTPERQTSLARRLATSRERWEIVGPSVKSTYIRLLYETLTSTSAGPHAA